ncbi:MAG: sugar kinase [Hyphomicrobiaceae bacterium]
MTLDVVAIGEPMYELAQEADGRFAPGFGGDTSNAVIAASRLGARAGYLTRLGTDVFGDALMALWQREGINARHVMRDSAAATGVYLVTPSERGHVFTYLRTGSAASRMKPGDFPRESFADARYILASGISLAISTSAADTVLALLEDARKSGRTIAFDTNLRLKLWPIARARAMIDAVACIAGIVKTSIEDAEALMGLTDPELIARRYLDMGARSVVVTLGRDGALAADANTRLRLPAHKVEPVDATGAGDAFMGALLAELSRGQLLGDAARFANVAAALSTLGRGAVASLPRRSDVAEALHGAR